MIGTILVLLVAAIHFYFVFLEAFAWEAPRTRRVFGMSVEDASRTKAMAQNQGLYNGFLAVGLVLGLLSGNGQMVVYLLLCVAVAGVIGALTAVRAALFAQTVPATLALLALWLGL